MNAAKAAGRATLERQRPKDHLTSVEAVAAIDGLTTRQLDYWTRTGRLTPARITSSTDGKRFGGSGANWWWSPTQIDQLHRVVARLAWGMTVDAAFRTIDPPLPAPSTLDQAAQPCTPGA